MLREFDEGARAFASATFVSKMTEFKLEIVVEVCSQVQYGVYRKDDDGLFMLGIVSEREDQDTKLVYEPPVPMLRFPLASGDEWSTETHARGPLCGSWIDYDIRQTWASRVDAAGALHAPYGSFDHVLRVNTHIRRHLGLGVSATTMRTHTFVAECFTSVANVASVEGVDDPEFDRVLEIRRLAPLP